MPITPDQAQEMLMRLDRNRRRGQPVAPPATEPVEREDKLHQAILDWCYAQWPRWKCVHSRMDKRTGQELGTPDFVCFGPFPLCVVVECKGRGGKRRPEQTAWAVEMSMLGWEVGLVFSLEEFHAFVAAQKAKHHL